jgi:hypothetical protein
LWNYCWPKCHESEAPARPPFVTNQGTRSCKAPGMTDVKRLTNETRGNKVRPLSWLCPLLCPLRNLGAFGPGNQCRNSLIAALRAEPPTSHPLRRPASREMRARRGVSRRGLRLVLPGGHGGFSRRRAGRCPFPRWPRAGDVAGAGGVAGG